jgi:hypothetical protein
MVLIEFTKHDHSRYGWVTDATEEDTKAEIDRLLVPEDKVRMVTIQELTSMMSPFQLDIDIHAVIPGGALSTVIDHWNVVERTYRAAQERAHA